MRCAGCVRCVALRAVRSARCGPRIGRNFCENFWAVKFLGCKIWAITMLRTNKEDAKVCLCVIHLYLYFYKDLLCDLSSSHLDLL